ncbi:flagellar assembly peptidoglycan hydrolase FlgJ, partial [Aromatoleum toluclasticum]|nr:flagellar assembly peptidoglycan hydrolase FlgJ [Aromatoleum toluclasticum]
GFARSLQQAGYATDPMYADKLTRIIGGATLRTALAG